MIPQNLTPPLALGVANFLSHLCPKPDTKIIIFTVVN